MVTSVNGQKGAVTNIATTSEVDALETRIDNIVAPSGDPSLTEVSDARVGADSTVYSTLKGRIDGEIDELNERLDDVKSALTDTENIITVDISGYGITQSGYIDPDKAFASSSSWKSTIIPVSDIEFITKAVLYTNNVYFYGISFFTSDTLTTENFVSGHLFENQGQNTFENIIIPNNATYCVICTRTATSETYAIEGVPSINVYDSLNKINAETQTHITLADYNTSINGYINPDGSFSATLAWRSYLFDVEHIECLFVNASVYSNSSIFCSIAFYKEKEISASNFISGIIPTAITTPITFNNVPVPASTKLIVVASRRSSGTDEAASIYVKKLSYITNNINSDIINPAYYKGELKAVYKNLTIGNDITFIGDELWGGQIIHVETNETLIHRYKLSEIGFKEVGTIETNFGHLNCMDYNANNDCLIFGNGSNDFGTTGNWFAVVKNPLGLGSTATLDDVAVVYNVDIGYKVQAVWGDSNLGLNNIVYLISNNAKRITKVLLLTDSNGDFTGEFTILSTHNDDNIGLGIGGAKYWGDSLYIGYGEGYNIAEMAVTDYAIKSVTKHFYKGDGTEYVGSTQGIHIDKDYFWVFVNSTSPITSFLLQYYR